MDSSSISMIIILAILIMMSAYFSATETAFSSLNRIKLKNIAEYGNKRAKLALSLSENYDDVLSTILIGNNVVNIASASLATIIFVEYFGDVGVTLSTIVMTIVVLIFGEITPKSLAKELPERFCMISAPIIKVLLVILSPFNFLFGVWKKFISIFFKVHEDRGITEEEIKIMVEEAENNGRINQEESELIRSAIEFNDIDVTDILTPRVDIVSICNEEDQEKIKSSFLKSGFSRLPVYSGTIDNIIGVVHQKDFYNKVLNQKQSIESIIKPVIFAVGSMKISELLRLLQQKRSHIAVIGDEYGGTMGIVTLEDILEELVGEIWDEHDEVIHNFEKLEENKFKVKCNTNLDKMFEFFNIKNQYDFSTVNGWIVSQFGQIPNEGDNFEYENLNITVFKRDYKHVIEIIVSIE